MICVPFWPGKNEETYSYVHVHVAVIMHKFLSYLSPVQD